MPRDWSWACWSIFMYMRLQRMRTVCNRHGITIDTSQSLFAEFIFQLCTDNPNYREYLYLPRVLWTRHPSCVSVAHKHQGKSMQASFRSRISKRSATIYTLLPPRLHLLRRRVFKVGTQTISRRIRPSGALVFLFRVRMDHGTLYYGAGFPMNVHRTVLTGMTRLSNAFPDLPSHIQLPR